MIANLPGGASNIMALQRASSDLQIMRSETKSPEWWEVGEGIRLDDFYRRAFAQGFEYHTRTNRGFLPAGLIEEIRALVATLQVCG